MENTPCTCEETMVDGVRIIPTAYSKIGFVHSCEYTKRRSALVSKASRMARLEVPTGLRGREYGMNFTKIFNKRMDELVKIPKEIA